MKKERFRSGFTLIELLVVIAIIAILASILFPVFASARERGRSAACLSNLKQLALAFRMYADDNNDRVPLACDAEDRHDTPPSGLNNIPYVWYALEEYTKSNDVWRCPGDKGLTWVRPDNGGTGMGAQGQATKNMFKATKASPVHNPKGYGSSYTYRTSLSIKGWNQLYGSSSLPASALDPVRMTSIPHPNRSVVFMDGYQAPAGTTGEADQQAQWHQLKFPNRGWNIVFADGHAKVILENDFRNPGDNGLGRSLWSDYYIRPDFRPDGGAY